MTAAGRAALETRALTVRFGGLTAVDNVSLAVEPGGVTSIIGPNGAGKSTLFNLISGALAPASGSVLLDGRDITSLPIHKRHRLGLARSFQITNLFAEATVFENLRLAAQVLEPMRLGLRPLCLSNRALARTEELIARFGLAEVATRNAGHLSHGQQRRLEIAAALAGGPRVLLLDEPTQGMSHADTEEVADLIRGLGEETTVMLIEHDIDLVMRLSRSVIVLHQGRKIAEGTPTAVRADPAVQMAYFGEG